MDTSRQFVLNFMKHFDYPQEAQICFLNAYDKIAVSDFKSAFFDLVNKYISQAETEGYAEIPSDIKIYADRINVHEYTLTFLFLMICAEPLYKRYNALGINTDIFYNSMYDLKVKLLECKEVKNIWGTFVGSWFFGFYAMRTFGLGRLEFQISQFPLDSYTFGNISVKKDDFAVFIHIPSGSPLTKEARFDSYRRAYDFFKKECGGGPLVICCNSWLLYPDNKYIFKSGSHILDFMSDFDIISKSDKDHFDDAWRIFGKDYAPGDKTLPAKTSLQRSFINWLDNGGKVGTGFGIILFDGNNIINNNSATSV